MADTVGGMRSLSARWAEHSRFDGLSEPQQILIMLATQFGLLVLVSLCTRPSDIAAIGPFYARIHTPVGKEDEVRWDDPPHDLPEAATLGMDGVLLDYRQVFPMGLRTFATARPGNPASFLVRLGGLPRRLGLRRRLDRALDLAGGLGSR